MKLIHTCHVQNRYAASNWSFENTYKLLFNVEKSIIEVGFFIHYKDEFSSQPIEYVIELPSSIGCPFRCAFCASSLLDYKRKLSSDELIALYSEIITIYNLNTDDHILVSFTGIGDFANATSEIMAFMEYVHHSNEKVEFTLSSCQWSPKLFEHANYLIQNNYPIRYFQIAYIAPAAVLLEKNLIPATSKSICSINEIVEHVCRSNTPKYRINYVMIAGINDDKASFDKFASVVALAKNKLLVRISRMNVTEASEKNALTPPQLENMMLLHTILNSLGVSSYLFYAEKNDNMNCGQLIAGYLKQ